jgi:hypothetical protein
MAYELFRLKGKRGAPAVLVTKVGRLKFNRAATELFVELGAESALLLWDADAQKIALRPINTLHPQAFKVHLRPTNSGFSATAFLEHVGCDLRGDALPVMRWNEEAGLFEAQLS